MSENIKQLEPLITKLFHRLVSHPNAAIFHFDGEKYELGKVLNEVASVAEYFDQLDLQRRFIVLSIENSPMFAVAFLAGNMCNLNVGVFSDLWPSSMVSKTLDHLKPDCFVYDRKEAKTGGATVNVRTIPNKVYRLEVFRSLARKMGDDHNNDHAFYTGFTSGSSGVPKGFVRNGLSWYMSFEADKREFGFSEDDIFICPGSFAHSLFLYAFLRALYAGAQVMAYRCFRPDKIIHDIQKMSATVLFVVPTQLLAMCEWSAKQKVTLKTPRLVLSAGAKLTKSVRRIAQEVFPNAEVVEFYGSSEHGYISVSRQTECPPEGSVGRAFDGVQILIIDSNGKQLQAGHIGQVFVNSPYKFSAYASGDENGQSNLPALGDFTGTGDTGYLDDNGFLHLSGRTDRMIVSSGRNIYPESVEAVLLAIPGVRNAAVFSRTNERRGQRLVAVVEFQGAENVSRKTLVRLARQELPAYAVPNVYLKCDDWPLTVSHKTDYRNLNGRVISGLLEIVA